MPIKRIEPRCRLTIIAPDRPSIDQQHDLWPMRTRGGDLVRFASSATLSQPNGPQS